MESHTFQSVVAKLSELTGYPEQMFIELSDKCLIAGGCVLSCLIGCQFGDVDVFLPNFKMHDYTRFKEIVSIVNKYGDFVLFAEDGYDDKSVFDMKCEDKKTIQLILAGEDVEGIFDCFDMEAVRVGIHQGQLIVKEDACIAISEMACKVFGSYEPDAARRAKKMIEKGFKVVYQPREVYEREPNFHVVLDVENSYPSITPITDEYRCGARITNPIYIDYHMHNEYHFCFVVEVEMLNKANVEKRVENLSYTILEGGPASDKYYVEAKLPVWLTLHSKTGKHCSYSRRLSDRLMTDLEYLTSELDLEIDGEERLYEVMFDIEDGRLCGSITRVLQDDYLPVVIEFDFSDLEERITRCKQNKKLEEKLRNLANKVCADKIDEELRLKLAELLNIT